MPLARGHGRATFLETLEPGSGESPLAVIGQIRLTKW